MSDGNMEPVRRLTSRASRLRALWLHAPSTRTMCTMITTLRTLPLPLFADEDTTLLKADCKRMLKRMEDKSVALIIVDPPYGGSHAQPAVLGHRVVRRGVDGDHSRGVPRPHPGRPHDRLLERQEHARYQHEHHQRLPNVVQQETGLLPDGLGSQLAGLGRVHQHIPRSQFESMHVYYRESEGKLMDKAGTFAKSYAFDQHVGRHN
eukprot:6466072-Prymnesium_polylepis.1